MPPDDPRRFPTNALVVDLRSGRLGRIMGHVGPYAQLRAPGGGREWDVDAVRLADADERLRASIAERPAWRHRP
ncbi:hypothetical protein [Streptomyces tsukubensis]|uniref:Uncharacterized protein n=1 Tax=Streptomyces tsukubensis TaxID=83656 RepID=A0A1V4A5V5_9ACTN|nr:hypothetical protein [Streptomyces tsukubensis]OON76749.1 hypothetical protein B1H18_20680 [Streptomyces tsukubensis]QFR97629.1 hypothetical protein GBW32_09670 [Streptomyces tsukubensis]